jgi:ribonucleoside-triphosphate reductase
MKIKKRNGKTVDFEFEKIERAVNNAFIEVYKTNASDVKHVNDYNEIINTLKTIFNNSKFSEREVEKVQDVIEKTICPIDFEVGKAYMLYRGRHKEERDLDDRINYMEKYSSSSDNAASSSETDANANITSKNVSNMEGEVYKTVNRRIQRKRMKKMLTKLYNTNLANQYIKDIDNHIIYVHDEASTPTIKNYCEAVSLYPLMVDGTGTLDGLKTAPPNNLDSASGQLINCAFLLSSQCKGAVAFGEFFNYLNYYIVKEFGNNWYEKINEVVTTGICNNVKTVKDIIEQAFQKIVFNLNQPQGNRSSQSPFTNISYYDSNYWKAMFDDFYYPDGTKPEWKAIDVLQKMFMKWFNITRTKTLLTFPVETMAMLTKDGDVIDQDYKDFTAEMYHEGHSFFTYLSNNPDNLASCCRLRNEVTENEFSFTNGLTGVQTGSCNVLTLNLNRIIQDCVKSYGLHGGWKENTSFIKNYLIEILNRVYKYHIAYKTMLYEEEDAGMLTASKAGYIKMNKLFSTVGLNGINEAAEFLGLTCDYNEDYKEFCRLITGTISEENKAHSTPKFKFNTEFVPAEGLSSKNYNWDKEDGYWVPESRNLYNSYFYIAHDDTSVLDKFKLHGEEFTGLMDGGVGLHCNLEEHLSKEQYLKLIDFAIERGTSYFTFNIPNTQCDDCGYITKLPVEVCPKCGSKHVTQWTRVIGFLRPIKCFDKYRYVEAMHRTYSKKEEVK